MRVRYLQLQGFKTFASKTRFVFQEGITAIVGPNGSGKSNVADALRWVLGEQSYSTLRSRRTKDVIFSGSSARPPLGLAEVSLLLDNEDGLLPIDFAEVEISRRAHRSGANEYYLNRRRVRLQDIQAVLGGLTSSYVVIHQGLVDEALSRRPRERRILLEEAAEVRRYHERRQKTHNRLERTEANMTRISDLRNELGPRLRKLKRQAKQARRWTDADMTLRRELRVWYRLRWENACSMLDEVKGRAEEARSRLLRARAALEEAVAEATRLRQNLQEAQRLQEERRRQEDELRRQERTLRQSLAQVEGERRALQRYQQELQVEVARWREDATEQEARQQQMGALYHELTRQVEQARVERHDREERLRQTETDLRALRDRQETLRQGILEATTQMMEAEGRLEALDTRQHALEREVAERKALQEQVSAQREQAEAGEQRAGAALAQLEADLADLREQAEAGRERLSQAQVELERIDASLEQARWQLAERRARLEALVRSGGPADGTPFLQEWARGQGGEPFSTLLSQLTIPAGLEAALEAALGPHAAALLAEDWTEGRAALDALSEMEVGRATLLLRRELRPVAAEFGPFPEGSRLFWEQLGCAPEDRPALVALLGQVLLAEDIEAARRIARELDPGWLVVTPQGALLAAEGFVSGGRLPLEQSALAREQERRSLVRDVALSEAAVQEQGQAQSSAQRQLADDQAALDELRRQWEAQRLRREEQTRQVEEHRRDLARLEGTAARQREHLERLGQEQQQLVEERALLLQRLQVLRDRRASLEGDLGQLRQADPEAASSYARARDLVQEARTAWAVVQKEQENQQSLIEMYRRNAERLQRQLVEGEERLLQTAAQLFSWEERAIVLQSQEDEFAVALASLIEPTGTVQVSLDQLARWDEEVGQRRQDVLEWEGAAGRTEVEVQRLRDRLREVLRRGLEEVGPEASAYGRAGEALLDALMEDPPEWAQTLLDVSVSAEELERRIALLREEIRRMGPVNPLAEEEYRQNQESHDFLEQQLQDLRDAARSLRQIIAELDQSMEERFQETFAEISREFQSYFTRLFGGGTAQLRLVQMDEEEGLAGLGVDILARPPGKRAHTLALLSGGERALTSTALLFAILKVNPRPFCLLDEVDAMLDEANVGRFRECLEELAERTQFIIITHNRVTVEAARTLYGVSLADDGTSQVLSLKLEEIVGD